MKAQDVGRVRFELVQEVAAMHEMQGQPEAKLERRVDWFLTADVRKAVKTISMKRYRHRVGDTEERHRAIAELAAARFVALEALDRLRAAVVVLHRIDRDLS